MDKILFGFIGALLALFLSALFSRFTNALKLNRIRIAIIHYLENIGCPKFERYIKDCLQAIGHSQLVHLTIEDRREGYDDMPMLTSDIFKSFSQTDLLIVMSKPSLYAELLNLIYGIEYVKKNMPVSLYNNFADRTNKHLEEKGLQAGDEQFNHIKTCGAIAEYRSETIHDLNLKIEAANNAIETLKLIVIGLQGKKQIWIWEYFWAY
jgi:hypothetical protein